MSDTLDERLRRALAAGAEAAAVDAVDAEPDLPAAFGRRRRRRVAASRLAVAGLALAAVVTGAVVWQASKSDEGTVTGPDTTAGEGALPVVLPDGYAFTVTLPPAAADAPAPIVSTRGLVTLNGCCPDATVDFVTRGVSFDPLPSPPVGEPVGSWATSSGLHLTLHRQLSAPGAFRDVRTITGQVGDFVMVIRTVDGGPLDDVAAAKAATDDLVVRIGSHGYPVLGPDSARLPSDDRAPMTPSPGVVVFTLLIDDVYGTSAQVDLGPSAPSLSVSRSTCTDDETPVQTTAGDVPVASALRCFPDADVLAYVQGRPAEVPAAGVERLARELQIEP